MSTLLVTAGLACVIAAIVGGGLKAFGIELPVLNSRARQSLLGALGLGLVGWGTFSTDLDLGSTRDAVREGTTTAIAPALQKSPQSEQPGAQFPKKRPLCDPQGPVSPPGSMPRDPIGVRDSFNEIGLVADPDLANLIEMVIRENLCQSLVARGYTHEFVNTAPISELHRVALQLNLIPADR
jgi:hypothetical protein